MFKVLVQPCFGLHNKTVSNFSYWAGVEWRKWIYENNPDKHRRYHWRYLLNNLSEGRAFLSPDDIRALTPVAEVLEHLLDQHAAYTLPQFLELAVDKCGVLDYIFKSPQRLWHLEIFRAFFDFVKLETRKNPWLDLNDLFELIGTMKQENIAIQLNKTLIDRHGVNFLTAHASKGLEFQTVFMMNSVDKSWNSTRRSRGFSYPPNLIGDAKDEAQIEEEENRRLFFVAMTRAKQNLHISYALEDDAEKSLVPAKFVDELLSSENVVEKQCPEVSSDAFAEFYKTQIEITAEPVDLIKNEWIDDVLENYYLSSTDLNRYLECPVSFYYEKVLRVPSAKHPSLALGSAAHEAIEMYIKQSRDEKRGLEKQEFLELYARALVKQKDSLTPMEFDNYLEYGKIFLGAYYDQKITTYDLTRIMPELNVRARLGEQTMIKGMIDRVEEFTDHLKVYDYKTGAYYADKFRKPGDEKTSDEKIRTYGGDYWRQAVFYALLLENSPKYLNLNIKQVSFEFLESAPDNFRETVVEVTLDDKHFVKNLSEEVFARIKAHEFDKGCGREDCKWCNLDGSAGI